MPLSMVKEGEPNTIQRVGGNEETKRFLENLGFVTGAKVTVVSTVAVSYTHLTLPTKHAV